MKNQGANLQYEWTLNFKQLYTDTLTINQKGDTKSFRVMVTQDIQKLSASAQVGIT